MSHSLRHLWWFLGGFRGAKIVKSEYNLINIPKSPKTSLNNNFVGNLIMYSQGQRQV